MWNFDAIKKLKKYEEEQKTWKEQTEAKINALQTQIIGIGATLSDLQKNITPQNLNARLEEIELWKNKLHFLMIEKTPGNREKLSRFGKYLKEDFK